MVSSKHLPIKAPKILKCRVLAFLLLRGVGNIGICFLLGFHFNIKRIKLSLMIVSFVVVGARLRVSPRTIKWV